MNQVERNKAKDQRSVEYGIPRTKLDKCKVLPSQYSMDHRCHAILIVDLDPEYRPVLLSMIQGRFPDAVSYDYGEKHPRWFGVGPHVDPTVRWPDRFYEQVCVMMGKVPQPDPRVSRGARKSDQSPQTPSFMR